MPKVVLSIIFFIALAPKILLSAPVGSNDLIKTPKLYDGKLIVYAGEAIGDIMHRDKLVWVNINDGDNAIGVLMTPALAEEIDITGSYRSRGDNIEVSGIFHNACIEHGGDLDIHAQAIRKVSGGRIIKHRLNIDKRNQSLILLLIIFLTWILTLFKKR